MSDITEAVLALAKAVEQAGAHMALGLAVTGIAIFLAIMMDRSYMAIEQRNERAYRIQQKAKGKK